MNALASLADALDCEITDLYRSPDRPTAEDLLRDLDDRARAQAIRVIQALRTGTGD